MNKVAVEQAVRQLVETIKLSEPYREYQAVTAEVAKDPEKTQEINRVRKAYFIAAGEENPEILRHNLTAMTDTYQETMSKKWVVDFMEKEQRYCRLVQLVQSHLSDVLDFDMSFLSDQE